jgi:short-subunit dehydrogenase
VSALCPGPIRTNIRNSSRNRPQALSAGKLLDVDLEHSDIGADFRWMEPTEVGEMVVEAIRRGDLYIITHPEMLDAVEQRFRAVTDAFRTSANASARSRSVPVK